MTSSTNHDPEQLAKLPFETLLEAMQGHHARVVCDLEAAQLKVASFQSQVSVPQLLTGCANSTICDARAADDDGEHVVLGIETKTIPSREMMRAVSEESSSPLSLLPSPSLHSCRSRRVHKLRAEWQEVFEREVDLEDFSSEITTFSDLAHRRRSGELVLDTHSHCQSFVVRPNAVKRLVWDILCMAILLLDILIIPVDSAFDVDVVLWIFAMDWVVTMFWTADIPFSFLTGYHDNGAIEMRPRKIAIKYLKSWFVIDSTLVLSDWVVVVMPMQHSASAAGLLRVAKSTRTIRILKVLKLLRFVRVAKINQMLRSLFMYIRSEAARTFCNITLMVVTIVIMNHYVACGWYFVGTNQGEPTWVEFFSLNKTSISYRYSTSLHWSLTQFTPAGMEIYATNQTERIYSVLVLLFAMVIFSWFISSITTALTHLRNLSSEQDKHKLMLRSYFSENDISLELNQRIWHHLQMSYWNLKRRQREKDIAILSYLPETLKSQLREELFMPSLLKVGSKRMQKIPSS